MQHVLTLLVATDKEQSFLWAVLLGPVATQRARLRGVIRIHLDGERPRKPRLVAEKRM
jgi:hypothetical protein